MANDPLQVIQRQMLTQATRTWGNEAHATAWLSHPHPELQGEAPASLLNTEAGRQRFQSLLAALEFSFPV